MMIKIHDIKPIVQIPDLSIYLYYSVIFLLCVVILASFYLLYKFLKPKEKTQEKIFYEKMQNLDFVNVKKTAYEITKYGNFLAKEERSILLLEELTNELEAYKYKKEIPSEFSVKVKTQYSIFMDSLDVR